MPTDESDLTARRLVDEAIRLRKLESRRARRFAPQLARLITQHNVRLNESKNLIGNDEFISKFRTLAREAKADPLISAMALFLAKKRGQE